MNRRVLKSKIHRATVTGADHNYEGSVTIDQDLMAAADIIPYEAVNHEPKLVFVDGNNMMLLPRKEEAGQAKLNKVVW